MILFSAAFFGTAFLERFQSLGKDIHRGSIRRGKFGGAFFVFSPGIRTYPDLRLQENAIDIPEIRIDIALAVSPAVTYFYGFQRARAR